MFIHMDTWGRNKPGLSSPATKWGLWKPWTQDFYICVPLYPRSGAGRTQLREELEAALA